MTALDHPAAEDLAGYAEHRAEPVDRAAIEAHLRQCHSCLREVAEIRTLIDLELDGAALAGFATVTRLAAEPTRALERPPPAKPRAAWHHRLGAGALGAAVAVAAIAIVRCGAPPGPAPAAVVPSPPSAQEHVVRLCGSDTIGAKLIPELVEAYLVGHLGCRSVSRTPRTAEELSQGKELVVSCRPANWPTLRIAITALGTAEGFDELARGRCDIAMASRQISDAERGRLVPLWSDDPREHVIALNGIYVIVNEDNPLGHLDVAALGDVFAGATTSWGSLTGSDRPIHLYALDDRSGTFKTFAQAVLGGRPLGPARRDSSNETIADLVAGDLDGIGFVGAPYLRGNKPLALAEPGGDELSPTITAIRTEDYPLSRRLYLYGPRGSDQLAAGLIAFATSDAGQAIVANAGFVDLRTRSVGKDSCAHCSSEYRALTENAHRVRVNLRFVTGSTRLDDLGERDLAWLAGDGLANLRDKDVVVLGFTDDQGDPRSNELLAKKRADAVADRLPRAQLRSLATLGFGTAMPVGNNRDERGQRHNRRVEVWVK